MHELFKSDFAVVETDGESVSYQDFDSSYSAVDTEDNRETFIDMAMLVTKIFENNEGTK